METTATHEEAAEDARGMYEDALRKLSFAAGILRGPCIDPSPEAMRTEMAITRAIESLKAAGFSAPKR